MREISIMQMIPQHPHLVQFYDVIFSPNGVAHIVMELVSGTTLLSALQSRGGFHKHAALKILAQIVMAMEHLEVSGGWFL